MKIRTEISNRMQAATQTWQKLNMFWKSTSCTTAWKINVYNAVVKAKLIYGLESVHLTKELEQRINAFQLRGFRKILNLTTTFVDRAHTNQYVYQQINQQLKHKNPKAKEILPLSSYLMNKRITLYGHIIRLDESNPMRQATLSPFTAAPYPVSLLRVGGPRQQWVTETARQYWKRQHTFTQQFEASAQQYDTIYQHAQDRKF